MNISTKLLKAAAGQAGAGLDIDEVFNTHLYNGNNGTRTVTNNIDLSGEGGLVWIKNRSSSNTNNSLFDTQSGATGGNRLRSNLSNALHNFSGSAVFATSSTGFVLNGTASQDLNDSSDKYVAWTFRKAPKFFDIVTYTGNGTAGRTISHNLGSVPGMMIVKVTNVGGTTAHWAVYHRGVGTSPEDFYLVLNDDAERQFSSGPWNDTAPTSNNFTVGTSNFTNSNGNSYVAYLFAHNDGDGGFGPSGNQDVIKCGSYTGGGTTNVSINLGFEPQWIMIKAYQGTTGDWAIFDYMRGIHAGGLTDHLLRANETNSEYTSTDYIDLTSTGFKTIANNNYTNGSGNKYIYMAIRRGPLAKPTDPSKVFHTSSNFVYNFDNLGFDADFNINTRRNPAANRYISTRMLDTTWLVTDTSSAEGSESSGRQFWDYQSNWIDLSTSWWGTTYYTNFYSWRRAPGFCDVVAYSGTGVARTINHNLSAVPEMMWVKSRSNSRNWVVYHKDADANPESGFLRLDLTSAFTTGTTTWNNTQPTASVFSVGTRNESNNASETFIAFLFASVPNVSFLGSYTGDGSEDGSKVIDCGFSSGSRFVLIKRTDSAGGWQFFDGARGIVAGNDSRLQLDNNLAHTTTIDFIDPDNSGFIVGVSESSKNAFNVSGANYIFYAIAN